MFYNLGEKTFLVMTKNPGYIKLKIDKFNIVKIKKIFKAIKKKSQKQVTNWKKILATHMTKGYSL